MQARQWTLFFSLAVNLAFGCSRTPEATTSEQPRIVEPSADKAEVQKFLPKVVSMADRLVNQGNFHKNKASNLKGKLMRHVGSL